MIHACKGSVEENEDVEEALQMSNKPKVIEKLKGMN
jgi:hypothetical protein